VTRGRRALRLLAETGREIGILIVVFAPLESVFVGRAVDEERLLVVIAIGLALIAYGIFVATEEWE
jgi:hypothetical protein